jgi:hypothetical protein
MTDWAMVQWSQAHQITKAMGVKGKDAPAEGVTPSQHFAKLMAAKQYQNALTFLAHALPRYEAVIWTQKVLDQVTPDNKRDPEDLTAMQAARKWIAEPVESLRRDAWELAQSMDEQSPEKLMLQAIYLSGGSIAPEDLQAVHPAPDMAAKLASAAILAGVHRSAEPNKALVTALESGERLASRSES